METEIDLNGLRGTPGPKEGLQKWIERISMKGRDVACAEQAYTGWDEENVDTDEMFEDVDNGRCSDSRTLFP